MISKEFYKNLPYYLRLMDESGSGFLKHLSNAVQSQFDRWEDAKGMLELINNPDTIPKEWAYWAQQKVGGAGTRDRWLGVGVHPDWPVDRMRRFLLEGWNYWNTKGTQQSIRWAIDFWLDWEKAQNPIYLEFRRPFGSRPTSEPHQWWTYTTPYGAHAAVPYVERQFLGGGDYPQQYREDCSVLKQSVWRWEYQTVWDDRQLEWQKPPETNNSRSGLGPRNVWTHFWLEESDWNKVSPEIHQLNPEVWHALARPQVFLWQSIAVVLDLIESPDFPTARTIALYDIDGFKYNDMLPWPANALSRTELRAIARAWQPDPYFRYGDFWGSFGGESVGKEDLYSRVEVLRFSPWAAFSYSIETVKTVISEAASSARVFGSDYLSVFAFKESEIPQIEIETQSIFSPAIEFFSDYQDLFGKGLGFLSYQDAGMQVLSSPAAFGQDFADPFGGAGETRATAIVNSIQIGAGADYFSAYGSETWHYMAAVNSISESVSTFSVPAFLWSKPYRQEQVEIAAAVFPLPVLPTNQWFVGERTVSVEVVREISTGAGGMESGESWTSTRDRTDSSEQQITERVQAIGFNGATYSDPFAWRIPATQVKNTSRSIEYLSGADYFGFDIVWGCAIEKITETIAEVPASSGAGVPWTVRTGAWMEIVETLIPGIPELTAPIPTSLWYVPYREWEEFVEVEIPASSNCWAGLLADVEAGMKEVALEKEPDFPPNLWGDLTPDSEIRSDTPAIPAIAGADYLSLFPPVGKTLGAIAANLTPVSLAGVAPLPAISSTANPYLELVSRVLARPSNLAPEGWWQYPGRPGTTATSTIPGGLALLPPQICFQFLDAYGNNFRWYSPGKTYQPASRVEPKIEQYRLCNIVDNFTLRKIENYREVVETIAPELRDIGDTYPIVQQAAKQSNWTLAVETDEELRLIQATSLFAEKDGDRSLDLAIDKNLIVEFVFTIGRPTHIRSVSLFLSSAIAESKTYLEPLNVHPKDKIGFKFAIELNPVTA